MKYYMKFKAKAKNKRIAIGVSEDGLSAVLVFKRLIEKDEIINTSIYPSTASVFIHRNKIVETAIPMSSEALFMMASIFKHIIKEYNL